jgi:AcrR family transcriptional regulator
MPSRRAPHQQKLPREQQRRRPRQARSRQTVEVILEAAARVFRREGFRATTNRVAAEAGVSIGSLYEYFPNKQALLAALAERHVAVAETEVGSALTETALPALLARLQGAILASQRYPSQALALLTGTGHNPLRGRAELLRARALERLGEALVRVGHAPDTAHRRARAALGAIGELTVQAALGQPHADTALCAELLEMAVRHCTASPDVTPDIAPDTDRNTAAPEPVARAHLDEAPPPSAAQLTCTD